MLQRHAYLENEYDKELKYVNKQRKRLIIEKIEALRNISSGIEAVMNDEDEARENIPENLQNGEAYDTSEYCSDIMTEAISDIQQIIENLGNIV